MNSQILDGKALRISTLHKVLISAARLVLFIGLLPSSAVAQLTQGANTLQFIGTDNPSPGINRTVKAFFGPNKTEIENFTTDGVGAPTNAGLSLDSEAAILTFISETTNLEGITGTWMNSSISAGPIVLGGVQTYKIGGVELLGNFTPASLSANYKGFITTQSNSTWYGNLSMNGGTTFSADSLTANTITTTSLTATSLIANTITTTSLTASSLTAGTLSVTGNTTMGGTLNMSNNRITNVADGINPTDAVNVRQFEKSQTESRAGISSVAAIAGIPSLSNGDDGVLGVGVGTFKGESAIAIGASKRLSDNTTFKFGVGTSSSSGDVTGSFGIGIKW